MGSTTTIGKSLTVISEFRAFVEHTENQLWQLFKSIDRDENGQLDKEELRYAFEKAGLVIDNSKLERFFDEVDTNHDGTITFDEWRCGAASRHHDLRLTFLETSFCFCRHIP